MEFIMKPHLLAAAVAVLLSGSPALAQDAAAPAYRAAVADTLRPADEVARDSLRHPAEMLAFAQVLSLIHI